MYIVINVIKAYACESLVKNTFGQTQFFSSQICHTWIKQYQFFLEFLTLEIITTRQNNFRQLELHT